VKVVFCTFNHNPFAELVPYSGSHNQVAGLHEQLRWSDAVKGEVWQKIVEHKNYQPGKQSTTQ
jgi:CRISPR/Cas system-associated endonuclease Cas1